MEQVYAWVLTGCGRPEDPRVSPLVLLTICHGGPVRCAGVQAGDRDAPGNVRAKTCVRVRSRSCFRASEDEV